MNPMATYQKRLREEVAAVENEIRSQHQRIEVLNKRLEGLKRALELVESEQPAIAELLRANLPDGNDVPPEVATKAIAADKASNRRQSFRPKLATQNQRDKMKSVRAHPASRKSGQDGGLKRIDMIAAVLKRHPGLSVRELIATLDREFGWPTTESSVTTHLYTNRKRFTHTKADRSANRPVTWSLK
jgi:hypothetical protein